MQAASGTLAAAITSSERTPVATVKVDWLRNGTFVFEPGVYREIYSDTYEGVGDMADLTPFLELANVDKSLATDLPDAAKVASGYGASVGTLVLAGAFGGLPLTQVFTAYDNPLTDLAPRVGAPVRVEMGMRTTAGVETLRQITGRIRDVRTDPDASAVTLGIVDNRELIRTPAMLPLKAGADTGRDSVSYMTAIVTGQSPAPSATYDSPLNTLLATPQVDTSDPWQLLQQLADAEQGIILFLEDGTLRFYNRNHLAGGSPVTTLTTDPAVSFANLKSSVSEETGDSVRNFITVPATPYALDAPSTLIWGLSEVMGVGPGGSIAVGVEFPGAVYSVASITYNARENADGSGLAVSGLVITAFPVSASAWTLLIQNPNPWAGYLVDAGGLPDLHITGQCIRPVEGGYTATRSDPGSALRYGAQTLDLAANPFRQSTDSAESLAEFLLQSLKEAHPTLSGVAIVGDPRLQLGDRVRVAAAEGLALDGEFWLIDINTTFSVSDGLAQTVSLREA